MYFLSNPLHFLKSMLNCLTCFDNRKCFIFYLLISLIALTHKKRWTLFTTSEQVNPNWAHFTWSSVLTVFITFVYFINAYGLLAFYDKNFASKKSIDPIILYSKWNRQTRKNFCKWALGSKKVQSLLIIFSFLLFG